MRNLAPAIRPRFNECGQQSKYYDNSIDIYAIVMTFFEVLDSTVFLELMDPTDGRSHSTIKALALSKRRDNFLWKLICAMIGSGPID